MKNRKLLLIVSLVLALTMSLGGTLAYLTDTDADVNVMTVGRVEIKQNEQKRDGSAFEQDQMLLPLVGKTDAKDENGYRTAANYMDKIVTVTNTGNTDAWVRTLIAFPEVTYEGYDVNNASTEIIHWNGYSQGDEEAYPLAGIIPGVGTATNNWSWGTEDGSVWPGNNPGWNLVERVMIGDKSYRVYIVTNLEKVAAKETTAPNLTGIYLDSRVDYDNDEGYYTWDGRPISYIIDEIDETVYMDQDVKIYVLSQAVQAGGFDTAWAAFDAAFPLGESKEEKQNTVSGWFAQLEGGANQDTTGEDNVPPMFADVVATTAEELNAAFAEGKTAALANDIVLDRTIHVNGSIFDGNGNTLDATQINTTAWPDDYAITLEKGSTVKNVNLIGGSYAMGSTQTTGDTYIDNVTIDDCLYAINGNGTGSESVYVTDSTVYGWISYSGLESFNFTNCTLGKGNSDDGYFVVYGTTNFTDCKFEGVFDMGARCEKDANRQCVENVIAAGKTITFTNCTYDGVKVTADNFVEYFYYGAGDEEDFGHLMEYCTIVVDGVTVDNSAYID